MGLHLCYELRLPDHLSPDDVDNVLGAMHAHALTLPFDQVGPPTRMLQSTGARSWVQLWASIIAKPHEEDVPPMVGEADTARAFLVNAGSGCETAIFGFLLRGDEAGSTREWFWHACCKTQYASTVSDAHLIKCHTSLVALLDHAVTVGVDVVVRDETHYWETRDEKRLLAEVGEMNRIVARLAGRFADILGDEHHLEAPIFEHPRFEHLEMDEE